MTLLRPRHAVRGPQFRAWLTPGLVGVAVVPRTYCRWRRSAHFRSHGLQDGVGSIPMHIFRMACACLLMNKMWSIEWIDFLTYLPLGRARADNVLEIESLNEHRERDGGRGRLLSFIFFPRCPCTESPSLFIEGYCEWVQIFYRDIVNEYKFSIGFETFEIYLPHS
jgi:hypothetical protein